jgi:hypothetical protein
MTPPVTHEVNPEQKKASNKENIGPRKKEIFQLAVTPGNKRPKAKRTAENSELSPLPPSP